MATAKAKAAGSKKTEDGVKTSSFSVVRSGPFRRAVNEAMDTLPHPKDMVPGKAKMSVELLEDEQVRIEYEVGYRTERRGRAKPAPEVEEAPAEE